MNDFAILFIIAIIWGLIDNHTSKMVKEGKQQGVDQESGLLDFLLLKDL